DRAVNRGRRCEIEEPDAVRRLGELLRQRAPVGALGSGVDRNVIDDTGEGQPAGLVHQLSRPYRQGGSGALYEVVAGESAARRGDDARGARDLAIAPPVIEGWKNLVQRQIAGAAEDNDVEGLYGNQLGHLRILTRLARKSLRFLRSRARTTRAG